jgi:hypothetical protein
MSVCPIVNQGFLDFDLASPGLVLGNLLVDDSLCTHPALTKSYGRSVEDPVSAPESSTAVPGSVSVLSGVSVGVSVSEPLEGFTGASAMSCSAFWRSWSSLST